MSTRARICSAVMLGVLTAAGLHAYSIWCSRSRSGVVRLALYLLVVTVFLIGGVLACTAIARGFTHGEPASASKATLVEVFFSWIAVVWIYLAINRRVLRQPLKPPA